MERKYCYKDVIIVIIIIIFFTLFFNSKGYINWAINLKSVVFKKIFLNILTPVDKIANILYLDSIYLNLRGLFLSLIKDRDKDKSGDIPLEKDQEESEINYSTKNPLKIIMLGDSMIKESISMAFLKLTKDNKELTTYVSAFYSSGLSRIDAFDWFKQLDSDLINKYDFAVIMLGMNDAQDIIENDRRIILFTEEWNKIYKDRLNLFIQKINSNVKKIVWIGLPFMRDKGYNERMIKLNNLIKEECNKYDNLFFLDPNKILYNNEGYKEYIKIKDKFVQVRIYDGKHFTKDGAILIMEELIKIIYNSFKFETPVNINRFQMIDLIY